MLVRDAMSSVVLTVGPAHTLRQAAELMASRGVGAAVVLDPDNGVGPGILTERDVLRSIGAGQDPDAELVQTHTTTNVVYASRDWSLERAAETMTRGGFRHLIVYGSGDLAGIVSVRDIVRCWAPAKTPAAV